MILPSFSDPPLICLRWFCSRDHALPDDHPPPPPTRRAKPSRTSSPPSGDDTLEQNPEYASSLGDHRFDDRWQDVSLAAVEARHAHAQDALIRLRAIDRAALSPADQINFDLYAYNLQTDIDAHRFRFYLCPLSQQGGVQTPTTSFESLSFRTRSRITKIGSRGWISFPRSSIKPPRSCARASARKSCCRKSSWAGCRRRSPSRSWTRPEDSPFLQAVQNAIPLSDLDGEATENADRASACNTVASAVDPRLPQVRRSFTKRNISRRATIGVGIWQIPDGDAAYAFYARQHTTTNLTPEQIHKIGLDEVDRITGEMVELKKRLGFNGTMPEFFQFLRTDPKFFFKTRKNFSTPTKSRPRPPTRSCPGSSRRCRACPTASSRFPPPSRRTRTPPSTGPARPDGSRAGMFCVNLYKPETRPKWEMTALALHESVPGHHLQISLAQELGALPAVPPQRRRATTRRSSRAGRSTRNFSARKWASTTIPTRSSVN